MAIQIHEQLENGKFLILHSVWGDSLDNFFDHFALSNDSLISSVKHVLKHVPMIEAGEL